MRPRRATDTRKRAAFIQAASPFTDSSNAAYMQTCYGDEEVQDYPGTTFPKTRIYAKPIPGRTDASHAVYIIATTAGPLVFNTNDAHYSIGAYPEYNKTAGNKDGWDLPRLNATTRPLTARAVALHHSKGAEQIRAGGCHLLSQALKYVHQLRFGEDIDGFIAYAIRITAKDLLKDAVNLIIT